MHWLGTHVAPVFPAMQHGAHRSQWVTPNPGDSMQHRMQHAASPASRSTQAKMVRRDGNPPLRPACLAVLLRL